MRPQYNNDELIDMIKRACSVPTSQLTYTPAQFVAIATDVLQTFVVPLIMSTREDYFVTFEDVLSTSDGYIPFPTNAVGSKLRNVCFVSQRNPLILINLPRVDLDVVAGVGFWNSATLAGFYVQGENIVLYPTSSVPTSTPIRLYFYRRCLTLAAPDKYGQVQSVDSLTNTVVLDFVPYDWVTGTIINSVGSQPNFLITNEAATISAVSAPSIILDSVEGIEVGDYIAEVGYTGVAQIPIEARNYLAQVSAAKLLEGLGDESGTKVAYQDADLLKTNLLTMISQRVDGSVKKVVNPDGGLRLAGGAFRRGWGF